MGTRGLTCVFLDNEFKVAQYGQWDHYPSGQGKTILSFLRGEPAEDVSRNYLSDEGPGIYGTAGVVYDEEKFVAAVRNCKFLDPKEIEKLWNECGANGSGWVTTDVSDRMRFEHPQFQRDMGALVLPYIQKHGGVGLDNDINFAADSLFCEWAYVIDYDKRVFEVYEGFIKHSHHGRFAFLEKRVERRKDDQYYPVILSQYWSLDDLPTLEEFYDAFKDEDGKAWEE